MPPPKGYKRHEREPCDCLKPTSVPVDPDPPPPPPSDPGDPGGPSTPPDRPSDPGSPDGPETPGDDDEATEDTQRSPTGTWGDLSELDIDAWLSVSHRWTWLLASWNWLTDLVPLADPTGRLFTVVSREGPGAVANRSPTPLDDRPRKAHEISIDDDSRTVAVRTSLRAPPPLAEARRLFGWEDGGYAETPCDFQKDKDGKTIPKFGPPVTYNKFKPLPYCIQKLIRGHEDDHYFDKALEKACDKKQKAYLDAAAKEKKYKKSTKGPNKTAFEKADAAYQKALGEWNEAVRKSECAAYKKDKECVEKLLVCCKEHQECCPCDVVKKIADEIDAQLAKNKCDEEKK